MTLQNKISRIFLENPDDYFTAKDIQDALKFESCTATLQEIHRAIGQLSKKKRILRHTSESNTRRYYCR